MLIGAFWIAVVVVLLGMTLALWDLRPGPHIPSLALRIVHGVLGLIMLGMLVIAIQGLERGVNEGVGGFGVLASWLFGLALLVGLWMGAQRLRGKHPRLTILLHAMLAIGGFVVFLAFIVLG